MRLSTTVVAVVGIALPAASLRADAPAAAAPAGDVPAAASAGHEPHFPYDPLHLRTIGLWAHQPLPCKLPKRDKPYSCYRMLEGPAVILSASWWVETIAARGDAALARGDRSWWLPEGARVFPLSLSAGEVLYMVGDHFPSGDGGDLVLTIYRP